MEFVDTVFGKMLKYQIPPDCDMVILCIDLYRHQPVHVLLPHQVYLKDLSVLVREHPGVRGITIIPCRSGEKLTVPLAKVCG